jgi:tetratricopeptide (TPR) repeat protein/tRNA A-37 threonylcarbamoyl transferase component Bud32
MAFYLSADNVYFSAANVEKLEKELANARDREKSKILNRLSKEYWWHQDNPGKIMEYARKALEWAQKFDDIDQQTTAWANIGFAHLRERDYATAAAFAQKSLDMAEKRKNNTNALHALNVLVEIYGHIPDYKKAVEIYRRMKSIYQEENDRKGIAKCTHGIATCLNYQGNKNIALNHYQEALNIYRELGEMKEAVLTTLSIGTLNAQSGYRAKALEIFIEAAKISETYKLEFYTAVSFNRIGRLYAGMNDYKNALHYYQKSLALYKKIDDTPGVVALMINIGSVHKALKQYDKALDCFHQALHLKTQMDRGLREGASEILLNIGRVFFEKNDLHQAMENYQKALELGKQYKELPVEANCYHYIGKIILGKGDLNTSLTYFKNSLDIAKKIDAAELMTENYKILSETSSTTGKYKKALEYFILYSRVKDRIYNEKSANKIAEMQAKYETERKEKEIEILKKDNQIQKLSLTRQRLVRNGRIIVFALLMIILVQFFKKYRYLLAFWKKKNYIGHYKVMDIIASGGMGIVYKAHDIFDKSRTFAIKVLRDEYFTDEIQKKRFKNEASIIDQFNHPNIVKIIERGESGGNLYIVMELLEGQTLSELIRENDRLTIAATLEIMTQVVDALVKIHNKNIIHRDLKPENIMLIKASQPSYFVKLLDFGLAKTKTFSKLTRTGMILGTIFYISPEQILGSELSPASDIYSLGIIYCEILTGQKPFSGEAEDDVIRQILVEEPFQLSQFRPDIPPQLDQLIQKMLSKKPKERPPAQAVLNTLKEIKNG